MKKIIILLFILISVKSFSQTDSMKLKTSISLQVRDWAYLNTILKQDRIFENVYDSMKVKLRAIVKPSLTTVVKVDSVKQGQIISLAYQIRHIQYGKIVPAYTRINNALRSNSWLIAKIDEIDDYFLSQYSTTLDAEIDELRSVLQ